MIAHLPDNNIVLRRLGREDLELQLLGRAGLEGLSDWHRGSPSLIPDQSLIIQVRLGDDGDIIGRRRGCR